MLLINRSEQSVEITRKFVVNRLTTRLAILKFVEHITFLITIKILQIFSFVHELHKYFNYLQTIFAKTIIISICIDVP